MPGPRHTLETARLRVRLADADDAAEAIDYDLRNAEHLRRWEPTRPADAFDPKARASALASLRVSADADHVYKFFARLRDGDGDGRIVAAATLSNVVRGAFQAAHLGYSVDAGFEGRGIAAETVRAVVSFAFDTLRLHRVMANYQPANERSGALLRRLGFVPEGYARDYLFLNGAWRDHILTALVKPASS